MNHRLSSGVALLAAIVLSACGGGSGGSGGSGSSPAPVPTTTISGVVFDAPIATATVEAWTFVNGAPSTKIGEGITATNGSYSFSIQSENAPLVLIASGGYYVEEASGQTVNLLAGQRLSAVFFHTTGQNNTVHITPFTHLAAGLASWRIANGVATNIAIDGANIAISNILGFSVIGTKPLSITDAANASAFASPGHQYGFLTAAISSWTGYASTKSATPMHSTHNSIAFAQLLYADVYADGMLDGYGKDILNNISQLALGVLPLSQTVYRHALAAHVVQVANSTINRSALTEAQVASFAAIYASNGDMIWAAATPFSFDTRGRAVGSFTRPSSGGWIAKTTNVTGTVVDYVAIDTTALRVDTTVIGNAPNPAAPVFTINASGAGYADGTHTLSFLITNSIGITSITSINVGVDNTSPTSTGRWDNYASDQSLPIGSVKWTMYPADVGSGITGVFAVPYGQSPFTSGTRIPLTLQANNSWTLVSTPCGVGVCGAGHVALVPIIIKDSTGNCAAYDFGTQPISQTGIRFLANGTC